MPAGASRALLAFEPEAFWEEYLEHAPPEALTDRTPATRAARLDELRATRERGYVVSDQDVTPGIAAFGAPIFDHTGAVRASLSVGGLRDHLYQHRERSVELLCAAAAEISRTLGYDGSFVTRAA